MKWNHLGALLVGVVALAGCSSYTKVTDPQTGKVYYTRGYPPARSGYSGTLTFTDASTGADINLDSSEVVKITKEDFERAVGSEKSTHGNSWRFGY
jgi:hypothetical protein